MQDIAIPELVVMNEVAKLMKPLSKDEAHRVITWLSEYFDAEDTDEDYYGPEPMITVVDYSAPASDEPEPQDADDYDAPEDEDFSDDDEDMVEVPEPDTFEAFYNKVAPKTVIQKALTAAYWIETKDEKYSWRSYDITKCLGTIGVKVNALSAALSIAEKKDEPLVELMSKSGDSMQARKTFRLSDAGHDWVADRID